MKKIQFLIIAALAIAVYYYVYLKPEIEWKNERIQDAKKFDWVLVDSSNNKFSLNPIRWFFSPINKLTFVNKNGAYRINDSIIAGQAIITVNGESNETDYSKRTFVVCDCKNGLYLYLDSSRIGGSIEQFKNEWLRSSDGLSNYLCPKNKYYYTTDVFGFEIDVSNLIVSGKYSPIDNSNAISLLKSNYPYKFVSDDEDLLRDALTKFLVEKLNIDSNSIFFGNDSLYLRATYDVSSINPNIEVDDLYVLETSVLGQTQKFKFTFKNQPINRNSHSDSYVRSIEILEEY